MARPKSPYARKVPVTINFDPVVLQALKDLAKELGRTVPSLVSSLAANQLLLLGRLAYELDESEEVPEANIRFNQRVNAKGRVEITRRMNDTVSDNEESMGRGDFLPTSTVGHEALGTAIPGASAHTPGREGEGGLSHRPRPRERVRL
jgi:hypothetical protein